MLLRKFFPGMEDFEKYLRKYKREIKTLEDDKAKLEKRAETAEAKAKANEKTGIAKQMHAAQLQADYNSLRRLVDSLPEDLVRQAQQQPQRTHDLHI